MTADAFLATRRVCRRRASPRSRLVFGSSTAGGAYIPGMSDYVVMVREQATVYLGGPPLVKMATGEITDDETLGGAEMHAHTSGVSDYTAENDADALRIGQLIMQTDSNNPNRLRPWRAARRPKTPPMIRTNYWESFPPTRAFPLTCAKLLPGLSMVPVFWNSNVIMALRWFAATPTSTAIRLAFWATMGCLFSESANKAAQFIQLCNQSRTPLVYLQNITGFMVGTKYEREGIIKHGSKMINAVATSSVPQFTVIVGGSYGAGNYAMCGRAYDPRFLWTWPNSQIAVMGGEQAAGVLAIVQEDRARKRGMNRMPECDPDDANDDAPEVR